ncbi:maleylpyruvate isomerase N-terminal domain-containing protein [Glycomyces sp. TRM65418]|uniref:maleylpyruvate isomerase N-terminal domain-containing protein n=1 Tax=Glycomyces sp. TRM65418 TaxID=2867006 RepID=UPI001CE69333|nr:maleylpyruvate isomerase N-terminal domain-containing protein [Glycomyces sp. TRM65418]MCC3763267.1 maleylpyruvate isomerase N-terminal domain-containing protein [Glycomyces sp. TRM65418]QZD57268.1 maleylpyruvate isomerase N-terminal domain-containing protein [Glycomyces sp. TRM65418]
MMAAVLEAFNAESERLATVLAGLGPDDWAAPTRCEPWDAAALTAHITMAVGRLDTMLDAPEPETATVDAAGYYRPDERFSPAENDARLDSAALAARTGGAAVAADFTATWRRVATRCAAAPTGRRVTTRHGDPMTLADFLTTRVVEVAVHGIDLADALDRPRWTTPEAADRLTALLLGPEHRTALADLGMDAVAFLAKATGRGAFTAAERARAEAHGLRWLTLG